MLLLCAHSIVFSVCVCVCVCVCVQFADYFPLSKFAAGDTLCVVATNLEKANIKGVESTGRIFDVQKDGKKEWLQVPAGAKVGERVTFTGASGEPDKEINPKKFRELLKELSTNDKKVAQVLLFECFFDVCPPLVRSRAELCVALLFAVPRDSVHDLCRSLHGCHLRRRQDRISLSQPRSLDLILCFARKRQAYVLLIVMSAPVRAPDSTSNAESLGCPQIQAKNHAHSSLVRAGAGLEEAGPTIRSYTASYRASLKSQAQSVADRSCSVESGTLVRLASDGKKWVVGSVADEDAEAEAGCNGVTSSWASNTVKPPRPIPIIFCRSVFHVNSKSRHLSYEVKLGVAAEVEAEEDMRLVRGAGSARRKCLMKRSLSRLSSNRMVSTDRGVR